MKHLITLIIWTLLAFPAVSQNISKGETKVFINDKGDTLIGINWVDAKHIYSDLLDYKLVDSLLEKYIDRDSLNNIEINLKNSEINKLETKNSNQSKEIVNYLKVISNNGAEIGLKDKIVKEQNKEIRKQRFLKTLAYIGDVVLPITAIILMSTISH